MKSIYQRQNIYLGAFFFFVARKRYLDMAINDGMAANLEESDQKNRAQDRGEEILRSWEVGFRTDYEDMTNKISQALWSSFWTMVVVSAISIFAAYSLQCLNLSLQFNLSKLVAYVGSALVGWAALMELGGNLPAWDGGSFPQKVHTVIFKAIFIPGALSVLTSVSDQDK